MELPLFTDLQAELKSDIKPDHEKLFDEICGKLNQLSLKAEANSSEERLMRMQANLQKSQEELKNAQSEIQEKISSLDHHSLGQSDLGKEIKKMSEQLEQERISNSKLSTDLAKSLEFNLKLQFEIEEVRSKMSQSLSEEKKHNQYLTEKNKALSHEKDLTEALSNDTKLELSKAKERITNLQSEVQEHIHSVDQRDQLLEQLRGDLEARIEEIQKLTTSLDQFEAHSQAQSIVLRNLSDAAEKKMIELKVSLDKKAIECQDYYSHLQQSMSQAAILRQENTALKDYISKISNLQQQVAR
jgi:chromosome segregation ATPase